MFILSVLGLCHAVFSTVQVSGNGSLALEQRLLLALAYLAAEHQLSGTQVPWLWHVGLVVAAPGIWNTGSLVVARRLLHCSRACGTFPGQRSNPCLLNWQADSFPLNHQGARPVLEGLLQGRGAAGTGALAAAGLGRAH